jgi:hypothetical protein
VLDVFPEDDGLGATIGGAKEFSDFGGHELGPLFKDEIAIEVAVVVFAILDELAVFIGLADLGPPAVEVFVEADSDDFVGG